jgi:cell wall-associated NlpC family hydrolase
MGIGTKMLAAGGIVYGIDMLAKNALSAQAANARLERSLKNAGESYKVLKPQIDATEAAGRKLGFTNEATKQALGSLVTATGSYAKAHKDLTAVQDISRFKNVDLVTAARLYSGMLAGNTRALRQLGIAIPPVTTNMDALKRAHIDTSTEAGRHAAAHAKFADKMLTAAAAGKVLEDRIHGQAKAFSETAAGALARFDAQIKNIVETVSMKLLPPLTRLLKWLLDSSTAHKVYNDALKLMKYWWDGIVAVGKPLLYLFEKIAGWLKEHKALAIALGIALGLLFAPLIVTIPIVIGFIIAKWNTIVKFFKALAITVRDYFNLLWDDLKIGALKAYKAILEPFTHLPFGMGNWAKKAVRGVNDEMDALHNDMQRNGTEMGDAWGAAFNRQVSDWSAKAANNAQIAMQGGIVLHKSGTVVSVGKGKKGGGVVSTAIWAANQPGASTSYVFGGKANASFQHTDCAGFTQAVMRANGISIGGTSEAQYGQGKSISKNQLQPGDLVFFYYGHQASPDHVGIYVGGGSMIADQHTGSGIVETGVDWSHYVGARRYGGGTPVPKNTPSVDPTIDLTGLPTKHSKSKKSSSYSLDKILPKSFQMSMSSAQTASHLAGDNAAGLLGEINADTSALKYLQKELDTTKNAAKRAAIEKEIAKITGAIMTLKNKLQSKAKGEGDKDVAEFLGIAGKVGGQFGLGGQFVELDMMNTKLASLQDQLAKTKSSFEKAKIKEEIAKIKTAAASLSDSIMITVMVNKLQSGITTALTRFDQETESTIKRMQTRLASTIDALDSQLKAGLAQIEATRVLLTPAEQALKTLQDQLANDQAEKTMNSAQKALADAIAGGDPQAILDAQTNLNDVLIQEKIRGLQVQATIERSAQDKAAQEEATATQTRFDAMKKDAQDRESLAEISYGNIRSIARTAYDEELQDQAALELGAELQDKSQYNAWVHVLNEMAKSWNRYRTWMAGNQGIRAVAKDDNPDFGGGDFGGSSAKGSGSNLVKPMARGGDFLVKEPTLFLAGEAGMERATFQPLGGGARGDTGGGGDIHIHFDGPVFGDMDKVAKQLAEPVRRELLRVRTRNGNVGLQ